MGLEILDIILRSVAISGSATVLASTWGITLGVLLGLKRFRGRFLLKGFFNAMLGIPTVALGLILYLAFSSAGPLGFLRLLYSPAIVAIGQSILITPIIVSFVADTIESIDPEIKDLARTLGASDVQASVAVLRESSGGVLLAVAASFNRAIAELGVALMVGGNIRGLTRVLTTFIALETGRGELLLGLQLTVILLLIVFTLNSVLSLLQRRLHR